MIRTIVISCSPTVKGEMIKTLLSQLFSHWNIKSYWFLYLTLLLSLFLYRWSRWLEKPFHTWAIKDIWWRLWKANEGCQHTIQKPHLTHLKFLQMSAALQTKDQWTDTLLQSEGRNTARIWTHELQAKLQENKKLHQFGHLSRLDVNHSDHHIFRG